jgi:hypothetical protein
MLSGRAPFHARSRDDSAAAVMARIKGGEFNFNDDAWTHVSAQAKYLTRGEHCDKYVKIASRQKNGKLLCYTDVLHKVINFYIDFCKLEVTLTKRKLHYKLQLILLKTSH